jgi:prolyl-tRNA synthetase
VTAVDRLGVKSSLPLDGLEAHVDTALGAFDRALGERAQAEFRSAFALASSLEELRDSKAVRQLAWCGSEECGHRVEEAIDGGLLGVPEGDPPIAAPLPRQCIVCGRSEGVRWALAGRPL